MNNQNVSLTRALIPGQGCSSHSWCPLAGPEGAEGRGGAQQRAAGGLQKVETQPTSGQRGGEGPGKVH